MNFEQAAQMFEGCIKWMQSDLKKYAERDDASQWIADLKIKNINTMIEFLNQAIEIKEELEYALLNEQVKYERLHHDTHRLALFCQLHQVNPNLVFKYSKEELQRLVAEGKIFVVPRYEPSFRQEGDKILFEPKDKYNFENVDQLAAEKYLSLKQLSLNKWRN
jgi:hypothetical protein